MTETPHHLPIEEISLHLDDYQQRLASIYGARARNYDTTPDNADWHRRTAALLVQRAKLQPGQRVLDIATGTGLVALDAAARIGPQGHVLGIDITASMLEQARIKARALGLGQIRFEFADAENLQLSDASFDHVLCCAALVLMRDVPNALERWRRMLTPGGWIGLQTNPETAFVTSSVLQKLAADEGIDLRLQRELGTPERLKALLAASGFIDIDILTEADGHFLTLEQALEMGPKFDFCAPGQHPPPLSSCTTEQMQRMKDVYAEAMCAVCTPQGIWNDCTSLFARARRPHNTMALRGAISSTGR